MSWRKASVSAWVAVALPVGSLSACWDMISTGGAYVAKYIPQMRTLVAWPGRAALGGRRRYSIGPGPPRGRSLPNGVCLACPQRRIRLASALRSSADRENPRSGIWSQLWSLAWRNGRPPPNGPNLRCGKRTKPKRSAHDITSASEKANLRLHRRPRR
jgi:hypothetical protein